MMKVIMWMQVHGRHAILKQVLKHHQNIDCQKLAVCSTDEEVEIVRQYGWHGYRHDNRPLGKKSDYGIRAALTLEWDYLVQINSDDFLSAKYWKAIKPMMEQGIEVAGIKDIYFVDSYTYKAKRVKYRADDGQKMFLGAGRLIRRDIVENTIKYTGCFFDWSINRSLDFHSERRMLQVATGMKEIESTKPLVMDLKSDENIWSFKDYTKARHNAQEVHIDEVIKEIGYDKPTQ